MTTISLVCSSIRPELWKSLHLNLSQNKVTYELIFIGPYSPKETLPTNIRYIKYFSKPAQCIARGILESKGEYLMIIADDIFFEDDQTLDKLYGLIKSNKNSIISCTYRIENKVKTELLKYDPHHDESPQVPISPLFEKKLILKYGSIDTNFIAIMYDLDLYLRFISNGSNLIYLQSAVLSENKDNSKGSTLNRDYWKKDRGYLDKNWVSYDKMGNISFNKKRALIVKEYNKNDLLIDLCVEPKGRWSNKYVSIFVGKEIFNLLQSIFLIRIDYFYYIKNKYKNKLFMKILLKIYSIFKG